MKRAFAPILAAAVVALATGWSTPADAGGTLSLSIAPTARADARLLDAGLQLYGIINSVRSGSSIRQHGTDNSAGLAQSGQGNRGIVHQQGRGHEGTLRQTGNGNSYGLFQFGRNAVGHAVQNGNGRTGATVQFGW